MGCIFSRNHSGFLPCFSSLACKRHEISGSVLSGMHDDFVKEEIIPQRVCPFLSFWAYGQSHIGSEPAPGEGGGFECYVSSAPTPASLSCQVSDFPHAKVRHAREAGAQAVSIRGK